MSMVGLAGACVLLIGIPMSVLLVVTDRSGLFAHERVHNLTRNAFRAWNTVPFLVQLVLALSLTHWLSGTAGGVYATIFPLTLVSTPLLVRIAEQALRSVEGALLAQGRKAGLSAGQIIFRVLLPNALPGLIKAVTLLLVSLVGYSAIVGAIGGGGLGDMGIRLGYQHFLPEVMLAALAMLFALVLAIQGLGDWLMAWILAR
jgi:D-methionine transport system permease protein